VNLEEQTVVLKAPNLVERLAVLMDDYLAEASVVPKESFEAE